jgi:putative nucleotidyltransferase with HDIG domain
MNTLGALVLGHGVFQSCATNRIAGLDLETLWTHSQETALAARTITLAESLPAPRAEEAYLAGLLHDVGKVVFATSVASTAGDFAQIDAHHGEVGAYLLGLWGFPNSIVEAVAFHHVPSHGTTVGLGLAGIVHIADRMTHARRRGASASADFGLEPEFLKNLGLEHRLPQWSRALADLESPQAVA